MIAANLLGILTICLGVSSRSTSNHVGADCTITDFSQVSKVVNSCTKIIVKSLNVPAKKTLDLNLKTGTTLTFEGVTKFGVSNWGGPLVKIEGSKIKVTAAQGSGFDGQGANYWDGKGSTGPIKPSVLKVKAQNSEFHNLNVLNCPLHCVSVHGNDILIKGWKVDVSKAGSLGVNTDGFDVSGQNIRIFDSSVWNQDDCIVVNRGSDLHFENIYCNGGHGLSLAIGMDSKEYDNNLAANIAYINCTVVNSINGIHVKTVKGGGPGLIHNITYNRITLKGITQFGIRVHQDYPANDKQPTGNVPIKDLKVSHVKGDMNGRLSSPVNIMCASGACSQFSWSDISITGNKLPCSMNFKPSGWSC